ATWFAPAPTKAPSRPAPTTPRTAILRSPAAHKCSAPTTHHPSLRSGQATSSVCPAALSPAAIRSTNPQAVSTRYCRIIRPPNKHREHMQGATMVSRRNFLGGLSAASMATLARNAVASPAAFERLLAMPAAAAHEDLSRFVKIAIGTGGHGHNYPGATMPFGAVQLGPDTGTRDWDHCSGYHYKDSAILGFSHTHLSGTGCIDMLDFLVMPATDDFHFDPNAVVAGPTSYRAKFSHADEVAVPGYYSVKLQGSKVHAELTATERVGLHKYTFPASQKSVFLVDLQHSGINAPDLTNPVPQKIPPPIRWSSLKIVGNDTIVGGRSTDIWAMGREIYFSMKFSKPFTSIDIYSDGKQLPASEKEAKG